MTHAPHMNPSQRADAAQATNPAHDGRIGGADAPGLAAPDPAAGDPPEPTDDVLVDQAGRPLGPRALRTRRKILEAAGELLAEKPMRDLRVIDIARRIGSSPATFYQYFKDVEDVVAYLASQAKEATPEIVALIGGDWEGEAGFERGKQISNTVIDHWEKYAPVLRARNNASDEGNMTLREERMAAMMPIVEAFRFAVERQRAKYQAAGVELSDLGDPLCKGTALASCLERMSMYHAWIEEMGSSREKLVETTATILQTMVLTKD